MAKTNISSLLGQKKEKEVLMNFQKTKNCKHRKKMEEMAEKRRDASRKANMKKMKDKIKYLEVTIKNSLENIKKIEANMKKMKKETKKGNSKVDAAKLEIERMQDMKGMKMIDKNGKKKKL